MKTKTIGFPCNIHYQAFVPSLEVKLNEATAKYYAENCNKYAQIARNRFTLPEVLPKILLSRRKMPLFACPGDRNPEYYPVISVDVSYDYRALFRSLLLDMSKDDKRWEICDKTWILQNSKTAGVYYRQVAAYTQYLAST